MGTVLQHLGGVQAEDFDGPAQCRQCGGDLIMLDEIRYDKENRPQLTTVSRCGFCGMRPDARVTKAPLTMSVGTTAGDLQKRVGELERENAALKTAAAAASRKPETAKSEAHSGKKPKA